MNINFALEFASAVEPVLDRIYGRRCGLACTTDEEEDIQTLLALLREWRLLRD